MLGLRAARRGRFLVSAVFILVCIILIMLTIGTSSNSHRVLPPLVSKAMVTVMGHDGVVRKGMKCQSCHESMAGSHP